MELSRQLARMRHPVHHVYFADHTGTPMGQTEVRPGDPRGLAIEGLYISRVFPRHSLLTRRQADIEYGQVAAERVDRFRPDVVISANMPLDAQAVLQRTTPWHKARFVFWLQDVYSVAKAFGIRQPISPVRVRKLFRSTSIDPRGLRELGYRWQYSLEDALSERKQDLPSDVSK